MARGDLSNAEWRCLKPLLPADPNRGGRWRDHRQVVNGMIWIRRTGSSWRDLPERYGPWKTCHERHSRWVVDGTWSWIEQLLAARRPKVPTDG
jgi:transposase